MIMKKFTATHAISVLAHAHEEGYLSTKVFCRLLTELGLLRRYMEENYNNLISEQDAEEVIEGGQIFQHFPMSRDELDDLDTWLEE
jgi:hypothetical protein